MHTLQTLARDYVDGTRSNGELRQIVSEIDFPKTYYSLDGDSVETGNLENSVARLRARADVGEFTHDQVQEFIELVF